LYQRMGRVHRSHHLHRGWIGWLLKKGSEKHLVVLRLFFANFSIGLAGEGTALKRKDHKKAMPVTSRSRSAGEGPIKESFLNSETSQISLQSSEKGLFGIVRGTIYFRGPVRERGGTVRKGGIWSERRGRSPKF